MDYKFVDTNVFVEIFARKGEKSSRAKKLISHKKDLFTTSLVLAEIEWVLRTAYQLDRKGICRYLKKILTVDVWIDDKKMLISVLNYYERNNVDWTDCLNMFLIKKAKINQVYSYDRGLNKFDWIKRIEP